jgi:hypothetical protein
MMVRTATEDEVDAAQTYLAERRRIIAAHPILVGALEELRDRANEAAANRIPVKARKIQELCEAALAAVAE